MDVFNCRIVNVVSCIFENNGPVTGTKYQAWRGQSGGLSIAYDISSNDNVAQQNLLYKVEVKKCTFMNNSAVGVASIKQSTSRLLRQLLFTGRGGGCAIIINSVYPANVSVSDCVFEGNTALSYGGGLYVAYGVVANHTVVLNRIRFLRNKTPGGAGGLEMGFALGGPNEISNSLYAYNVEFVENEAGFGGGAYFFVGGKNNRKITYV